MNEPAKSWRRARRSIAIAAALMIALAFAAANFVLVDVRLFAVTVQVRLAWAVLVPALLAFIVGRRLGRLSARAPERPAPGGTSEATAAAHRRRRDHREGSA